MSLPFTLDRSFHANARAERSFQRGYRHGSTGAQAIHFASDAYIAGYLHGRKAYATVGIIRSLSVTAAMILTAGTVLYTLMPW